MKPDVLETLQKLPLNCLTRHPTSGDVIALQRGHPGFFKITTRLTPEQYNEGEGVTLPQLRAMEAGSIFGWHCPGADPDTYNEDGTHKRSAA